MVTAEELREWREETGSMVFCEFDWGIENDFWLDDNMNEECGELLVLVDHSTMMV